MRPAPRTGAACLLVLGLAGPAFAQDEGRKLFNGGVTPSCAICHTLKDAGAAGEIGPSLDELKPDAARVAKALRTGIGQMPAFPQLTDAQVQALARYIEQATR